MVRWRWSTTPLGSWRWRTRRSRTLTPMPSPPTCRPPSGRSPPPATAVRRPWPAPGWATSTPLMTGNATAARAWFERATRLIEGEPPCIEQGWVAVAALGCDVDDPAVLLARAELALARARQFGDVNLETKALADAGLACVQAGRVDEGMTMLDEAMALACGPVDNLDAAGKSVCSFFTACYLRRRLRSGRVLGGRPPSSGSDREGGRVPQLFLSEPLRQCPGDRPVRARALGRGRGHADPRHRGLRGRHGHAELAPRHRPGRAPHPSGPSGRRRDAAARQGRALPGPASRRPPPPGPRRSRPGPGHRRPGPAGDRRRPPAGRRPPGRAGGHRAGGGRPGRRHRCLRRPGRPAPRASTCPGSRPGSRRVRARVLAAAGDIARSYRHDGGGARPAASRRCAPPSGHPADRAGPAPRRGRQPGRGAGGGEPGEGGVGRGSTSSSAPTTPALLERVGAPVRATADGNGNGNGRIPRLATLSREGRCLDGLVRRHPVPAHRHQGHAVRRRAGARARASSDTPSIWSTGWREWRWATSPSTAGGWGTPARWSTPRPGPPTGTGSKRCGPRSTTPSTPAPRITPRALQAELDQLVGQLAQAFGLGGRGRRASSAAERARLNVTRALRAATARVQRGPPRGGTRPRSTPSHRHLLRLRARPDRRGSMGCSDLTERDRP